MGDFSKMIISLTISGSFLIIIYSILRYLLKQKHGWRWKYYLWLLVIIRFIAPYSLSNSVLNRLFRNRGTIIVPLKTVILNRNAQLLWSFLLPYLWIPATIVAALLLTRRITSYQSFSKYLYAGSIAVDDPDILDLMSEICEELNVNALIELYINDMIASPLLIGVKKPAIFLPNIPLEQSQLRYILLHELIHYQRKDMYFIWLTQLAVCVHWFNPLIYWMSNQIECDRELSCDEAVMSMLAEEERKYYGDTLLKSLAVRKSYREPHVYAALRESANTLKERLAAILGYQLPSKSWYLIAMMSGFLLFSSGLILGAHYRSDQSVFPEQNTNQANLNNRKKNSQYSSFNPMKPANRVIMLDEQLIKDIDIQMSVGYLKIKTGEIAKIEIGTGLDALAVCEVNSGVLSYFDHLGEEIPSELNKKDYSVTLTLPEQDIYYETVKVNVSNGGINISDVAMKEFELSGQEVEALIDQIDSLTAKLDVEDGNLDIQSCNITNDLDVSGERVAVQIKNTRSSNLTLSSYLGEVIVNDCTITGTLNMIANSEVKIDNTTAQTLIATQSIGNLTAKQLNVAGGLEAYVSQLSKVDIQGNITGNLILDSDSLGQITVNFNDEQKNYLIDAENLQKVGAATLLIDGKEYDYPLKIGDQDGASVITIRSHNVGGNHFNLSFNSSSID